MIECNMIVCQARVLSYEERKEKKGFGGRSGRRTCSVFLHAEGGAGAGALTTEAGALVGSGVQETTSQSGSSSAAYSTGAGRQRWCDRRTRVARALCEAGRAAHPPARLHSLRCGCREGPASASELGGLGGVGVAPLVGRAVGLAVVPRRVEGVEHRLRQH